MGCNEIESKIEIKQPLIGCLAGGRHLIIIIVIMIMIMMMIVIIIIVTLFKSHIY